VVRAHRHGGGLLASTILKNAFDRPRPDVAHYSYVSTSSFPSGHSMMSAVVYLTLGSLLTRVVPERSVKVYLICVALFLTLLVGLSRVYMGVHYPTDVWPVGRGAGVGDVVLAGRAVPAEARKGRKRRRTTPRPGFYEVARAAEVL